MTLSSHQKITTEFTDEWLTPPDILNKLGRFDLDPCAPINPPWPIATFHFNKSMDGLSLPWHGRVWLNPPFGKYSRAWMDRMAKWGNGVALLPARTETQLFFETVWPCASALLFIKGRPHFHYVDGSRAPFNSGVPIVLIAYGQVNAEILKTCDIPGAFVRIDK